MSLFIIGTVLFVIGTMWEQRIVRRRLHNLEQAVEILTHCVSEHHR